MLEKAQLNAIIYKLTTISTSFGCTSKTFVEHNRTKVRRAEGEQDYKQTSNCLNSCVVISSPRALHIFAYAIAKNHIYFFLKLCIPTFDVIS
jgi:hypothetical protein